MNIKCISHFGAGAFGYIILVNIYICCGAVVDNLKKETTELSSLKSLKDTKENILNSKDLILHEDVTCNEINKCKNGGICNKVCQCPKGTSGNFCEEVDWCENYRCGSTDEVECLYNETSTQGFCKCKKSRHLYDDNTKTCKECDCGYYGECTIMENVKKCNCKKGFAQYKFQCLPCECGFGTIKCLLKAYQKKVCVCEEKYAQRTYWGNAQCQPCDCGDHGECRYDDDKKICECEEHYKEFRGECRECFCGYKGSCKFDFRGEKICSCDYGFSSHKGMCIPCNCDPHNIRNIGTKCTFVDGKRRCFCPIGFKENETTCEDIDECLDKSACPPNTNCINVPGTYHCECKTGYEIKKSGEDAKDVGCQDIDECSIRGTCFDSLTECINSPGSYDCVCNSSYFSTAGTKGESYIPMYNMCYPATDQWLAATIALGTIMFFGITTSCCYMILKDKEDRTSSDYEGLRSLACILELIRICL